LQRLTLQVLLAHPAAEGKQAVFSTTVSTQTRPIGHSVRTDRFRYIEWDEGRGGRQPYDYESISRGLTELAGKPVRAEWVQRMRARLTNHVTTRSTA
jgi:iduronate 2-sulfatase